MDYVKKPIHPDNPTRIGPTKPIRGQRIMKLFDRHL